MAHVLILNCGSSSVKFSLFHPESGAEPFKGLAERLLDERGHISFKINGEKSEQDINGGHAAALAAIVEALRRADLFQEVAAIGHRVVHGGEHFSESVRIDEDVIHKIEDCIRLAPLHNPAHVLGIRAAQSAFPDLPQVAVFDTAFHRHLPESAYLYAIPYRLYRDQKIRRYGFHGSSYRYIAEKLPALLQREEPRTVICHLGNGASVAAVRGQHSLDTSMGLTPLEGLMQGTRSGDIDPALFAILATQEGMSLEEVDAMLWKESGLLGVSELSNDCRVVEEAAADGHEGAQRALRVYARRLAKTIAAQMVALEGADALVFTGGIGENSPILRAQTVAQLGFLGFKLDEALNAATWRGKQGIISSGDSLPVWVIPTNEEMMIARDTLALAGATP